MKLLREMLAISEGGDAKAEAVAGMLAALKRWYPDAHVYDGDRIGFTRETPRSSDTFFLWAPALKKGKWTWELGVQGGKRDLEAGYDLQTPEDVRAAVKGVNRSWFRENDPDWDD